MTVEPSIKARVRKSGLTLVEVLPAVGGLGVLVAITLPRYGDYRDRAVQTRAIHDIVRAYDGGYIGLAANFAR